MVENARGAVDNFTFANYGKDVTPKNGSGADGVSGKKITDNKEKRSREMFTSREEMLEARRKDAFKAQLKFSEEYVWDHYNKLFEKAHVVVEAALPSFELLNVKKVRFETNRFKFYTKNLACQYQSVSPQPQSTNPEEDDETVQINCDRCSRTLSNKWSIANSWTCQHDECAGCCYDVCNNCHVKPSSYVRPPRIVIPSDITGFETGGNGCGEEPTLEHFEIAEASKHLVSVDSLKVWLLQSKNLEGMDDDYPVLIGSCKYFLKDFYNRETKQWDDDYLADVIFEESDYGSTIQFQLKLGIPTFEPKHHPSVPVSTASDVHALLYGKSLQVITKIGSIELQPGEMYEGGSWHVEGMMDERIVATSCVYLENENVTESELYFRTGVNCPRKQ